MTEPESIYIQSKPHAIPTTDGDERLRIAQLAYRQTAALARTIEALTQNPKLDDFFGLVLTAIAEQLGLENCAVFVHDPLADTLTLHVSCNSGRISSYSGVPGVCKAASSYPYWERLRTTRQPTVFTDIESSPESYSRAWLLAHGMRSVLSIPLVLGANVVGFLNIPRASADAFAAHEIELAQALAQQAALAIQLTRLAEAARQSAIHQVAERAASERATQLTEINERLSLEINERRRVEEALRESEVRFRTLFEQSPLSMQFLRPDGTTIRVNAAFRRLFGVDESALEGYSVVSDPQLVERGVMPLIHRGLAGESMALPPVHYDARLRAVPRGVDASAARDSWTQAFLFPVKDADGRFSEIVLMHQDITELKKAEQLARGQAEGLKRTLDALTTEPDLDKFLGQVLASVSDQLGGQSAGLWFNDPETMSMRLHLDYDGSRVVPAVESQHPGTEPLFLPSELWASMSRDRQPFVYSDIPNDLGLMPFREHLLKLGIQTVLVVPLFIADRRVGSIGVRFTHHRAYEPQELDLAMILAQQAVLAIELTRLADQAKTAAVLEERNRMAREIHDSLGQNFAGVIIQLQAASDALLHEPASAPSHLKAALGLAKEGLAEARRSIWSLRPRALEQDDLPTALTKLVKQHTAATPLSPHMITTGISRPLPPDVEVDLLRICQEAIGNTIKHAHAHELTVEFSFEEDGVCLEVRDDGQGFDADLASLGRGFGLISMHQRAQRLGGDLIVMSHVGEGTRVTISVPTRSKSE